MAIAFGAIGTKATQATGATPIAIAYPATPGAGDMAVTARGSWNTIGSVPSTEAGWTQVGELFGGNAGGAVDNHKTHAAADILELTGSESGSVNFDIAGTVDGAVGVMLRYTKGAGETWDTTTGTTGDDATHAANRSITGSGNLDLAVGDMVVVVVGTGTDAALTITSPAITAPGITFGTTNRRTSGVGSAAGQDGNVEVFDALVTAGSGTVAPTLAFTTATSQSGPGVFVRLRVAAGTTPVTATRATTWRVRAPVTGTRATTWDVLTPATGTRATTWRARAAITGTRATTWRIRATVTGSRATTWDTRAVTTGSRATTWDVLTFVSGTRATTWDVRTVVTSSRATTWDTLATVGSSRATTWRVLARVTGTRATTWNVASSLLSVTSSRATSWRVRAQVTGSRATTWRVLARATGSCSTTWDALSGVTGSRATTWRVRAHLTTSRATTWRALQAATAARGTTWRTLEQITAARSSTWNVESTPSEGPVPDISVTPDRARFTSRADTATLVSLAAVSDPSRFTARANTPRHYSEE